MRNRADFENDPLIINAIQRGLIEIHGDRIIYNIHQKKSYNWSDPEEWVRARTVAFLVLEKSYTPRSIRTEVIVPRRRRRICRKRIAIKQLNNYLGIQIH